MIFKFKMETLMDSDAEWIGTVKEAPELIIVCSNLAEAKQYCKDAVALYLKCDPDSLKVEISVSVQVLENN